MPRRFWLQNTAGARLSLNEVDGAFFAYPSGLGYDMGNAYANTDGGFFAQTRVRDRQSIITGDLFFPGYAEFSAAADWLASGEATQLVYAPQGTEYYRDIDITSLGKTEIEAPGWLRCSVAFTVRSPWYVPGHESIAIQPAAQDLSKAKRYAYRYAYRYTALGAAGGVTITAEGHYPAAVRVFIPGPVTNPVIELETPDGAVLGRCAPSVVVPTGGELVYDSRIGSASVRSGDTDLMPYIDISDNNFFRLPQGTPARLTISAETVITGTIEVDVFQYYRVV